MFSLFQFLGDEDLRLTILDIGAAFLEAPSYQPLVDAGCARIIGFEPDSEACEKLNKKYGDPHRFYPYFVGDGGPATFHETNWGPTGSLFEPNTPLLDKFQLLAELTMPVGEHAVATRRLDDIAEIQDVDFLKIDVQGAELGIFQNAHRALDCAVLIQTEVSFLEYYVGQPMFADIDTFLRGHGFQFHDFTEMGSRSFKPLTNPLNKSPHPMTRSYRQRIWSDAYYVKDWLHFERLTPAKLKAYAVLMHDVVGSYDLAHLVLCELDKRAGSDHAKRYLRLLQDLGLGMALRATTFDENWLPVDAIPEANNNSTGSQVPETDSILLETEDGTLISVPPSLDCMTTHILLEQERWFEKELAFVLKWLESGRNAVDIGANVGVYALAMARRVAPNGTVFAFEPGSTNRRNLEIGRVANDLRNLGVSACALSDQERPGWLQLSSSGELNTLTELESDSQGAERVRVTTLDAQEREQCWPAIDFVKIDAEGQEHYILKGGRHFLERQSPLLMLEVKHGTEKGPDLRPVLQSMGYASFRLLGDSSFLVPLAADERVDSYELNLFWAKPDRAIALAEGGHLAFGNEIHCLSKEERSIAIAEIMDLPYARYFEFSAEDILESDLGPALVAFGAYRFLQISVNRRLAALREAFNVASAVVEATPSATNLATLARIALAFGQRRRAVEALGQLVSASSKDIDAPFFPACARYEDFSPEGREMAWFIGSVIEQLEVSRAHSSLYVWRDGLLNIKPLCDGPFVSAELIRRMILVGILAGMEPPELAYYVRSAHRYPHRNADFWARESLESMVVQACAARKEAMGTERPVPDSGRM